MSYSWEELEEQKRNMFTEKNEIKVEVTPSTEPGINTNIKISGDNAPFLGWWITNDGSIAMLELFFPRKGVYGGWIFNVEEPESQKRENWNLDGISYFSENWNIKERIPDNPEEIRDRKSSLGDYSEKVRGIRKRLENVKSIDNMSVLDPVPVEALKEKDLAIRNPVNYRYDILDPLFLELMSQIADYGAKKYGALNWQNSRLEGEKGAINHIYDHLKMYRNNENYDHKEIGESKSIHLAAIAFNAMMEFYWSRKEEGEENGSV